MCCCVEQLSVVVALKPQAAFAAMSWSLQFEWIHVQCVVPDCAEKFVPLRNSILTFYSTFIEGTISDVEFELRICLACSLWWTRYC